MVNDATFDVESWKNEQPFFHKHYIRLFRADKLLHSNSRLTISYTRRDEQQQTSDQSQCDKCLNTIYVRANAIKNILEKIKELNIPTYGARE